MTTESETSRREFLGVVGAGVAAAGTLAAATDAAAQAAAPTKIVDFHNHYVGPSFTLTNLANVPPAARPAFEAISIFTSAIPRTSHLVDIGLDWVRQRPGPSQAVLEGLLLGETAPHRERRLQIEQPALIVGHPGDPLHPFSDSGMLAEELANARLVEASSPFEWRFTPGRLNAELGAFLEEI